MKDKQNRKENKLKKRVLKSLSEKLLIKFLQKSPLMMTMINQILQDNQIEHTHILV